jgi:hypothetical protein
MCLFFIVFTLGTPAKWAFFFWIDRKRGRSYGFTTSSRRACAIRTQVLRCVGPERATDIGFHAAVDYTEARKRMSPATSFWV